MAPPPVSIYVTSLTSQPKVRQNIELLRRSLRGLEIPYTEHDLVMEEDAKQRWQRAKPSGQIIGLPGYLVGGEWIGTMDDFEYAAETATLPNFLRQDTDLAADQSVGEAELERLMRELSDADLDALAAEVGKGDAASAAKQGKAEDTTTKSSTTTSAKSTPAIAQALKSIGLPEESVKGVSTAAQQTVDSIAQTASSLVASLGLGGTTPTTGEPASEASEGTAGSSKPDPLTPADTSAVSPTSSSPIEAKEGTDASRPRRMSKQEIADKMKNADSLQGLLESLDLAEGKESKEKTE